MSDKMTEYLKLTKPTIMLLVLFTGGTAMVVEGSMLAQPGRFLLFLFGFGQIQFLVRKTPRRASPAIGGVGIVMA